jgi:HlyD family secretion protein
MMKEDSPTQASNKTAIDFLPDADEIERRPAPLVARLTLHVALLGFLAFLAYATWAELDVIVSAKGRLITTRPNVILQPLDTSIIQSINVKTGQVVHKGDVLAELDPTFTRADESQLKTKLNSLNTQWESINAELNGRKGLNGQGSESDNQIQSNLSTERQANYVAQVKRQEETIARLRSTLETAQRDEMAMASRVKVLKEMETMTEDLVNKKLAVTSRLLDIQDRLLEAQRSMQLAKSKQSEVLRDLAASQAEKQAFQTGWRQKMLEELLSISRERDSIKDQLEKASRHNSLVSIVAPVDAVVLEMAKLSQGSIIREAESFFTLVPISDTLQAEVQIESADIGLLRNGDSGNIKIDAFPFQKYGTLEGKLTQISQDSFRRDANSGPSGESYYTAKLKLSKQTLNNMPLHAKLLPGMGLSAEIVVGKRTVLSYLIWPLVKASSEALREP